MKKEKWGEGFFSLGVGFIVFLLILLSFSLFIEHSAHILVVKEKALTTGVLSLLTQFLLPLSIGLVVATAIAYFKIHLLFKDKRIIYASVASMVAVLLITIVPNPFVESINDTKRWIAVFGLTLQATELVKILFIGYLAFISEKIYRNKIHTEDIVLFFTVGALILAIALAQSHYGFLIVCIITALLVIPIVNIGSIIWKRISKKNTSTYITAGIIIAISFSVVGFGVYNDSRFESISDRILNPNTYHQQRNIEAIQAGGLFGRGRQEQHASHSLVPEQNTDSIFSFVVYEYGVSVGALVIAMYGALATLILLLASHSNTFERFFAIAIAALLFAQATVNISFSLLSPLTGEILPFLSVGGTALIAWLIIIGLLFSIYRTQ